MINNLFLELNGWFNAEMAATAATWNERRLETILEQAIAPPEDSPQHSLEPTA